MKALNKLKRYGILLVFCGWPFGLILLGNWLLVVGVLVGNGWGVVAWLAAQDQKQSGGAL